MTKNKIVLLLIICSLIISFFLFDFSEYLTLEFLNSKRKFIYDYYTSNPVETGLIYVGLFTVLLSCSLPGSVIVVIAGGAIFGMLWGLTLASFATATGSTIAFLFTRYLFRDAVQNRFSVQLKIINEGIEKDGAFYLFMLRVIPIMPFPMANLLMSLTPIRVITFYFITLIGMLPLFSVLVYAGTQIAKIKQVSDIFSLELIIAFVLLGIFPLVTKKTFDFIKSQRKQNQPDCGGSVS